MRSRPEFESLKDLLVSALDFCPSRFACKVHTLVACVPSRQKVCIGGRCKANLLPVPLSLSTLPLFPAPSNPLSRSFSCPRPSVPSRCSQVPVHLFSLRWFQLAWHALLSHTGRWSLPVVALSLSLSLSLDLPPSPFHIRSYLQL